MDKKIQQGGLDATYIITATNTATNKEVWKSVLEFDAMPGLVKGAKKSAKIFYGKLKTDKVI